MLKQQQNKSMCQVQVGEEQLPMKALVQTLVSEFWDKARLSWRL